MEKQIKVFIFQDPVGVKWDICGRWSFMLRATPRRAGAVVMRSFDNTINPTLHSTIFRI